MDAWLERFFTLRARGTNLRAEPLAGATAFLAVRKP
jgi:xanthine/uracil/vitamin C permease (AzgA family)